jgi:hypothetical protein
MNVDLPVVAVAAAGVGCCGDPSQPSNTSSCSNNSLDAAMHAFGVVWCGCTAAVFKVFCHAVLLLLLVLLTIAECMG